MAQAMKRFLTGLAQGIGGILVIGIVAAVDVYVRIRHCRR
jgi:hypothetical protein